MNYYVYKNGDGQFFRTLGAREGGTTGYFYVGFDKEWPTDAAQTLAPTRRYEKSHRCDLDHIRFVAHDQNYESIMLLTFEETELRFWKVAGPVVVAPRDVWEDAGKLRPRPPDYEKYFSPDNRDERLPLSQPFRVLPVRLVAVVPRESLYTSVDSLASYQYLIRGTCRPLWRAKGPTAAVYPRDVMDCVQSAIPGYEGTNGNGEEPFAAFVRLYLNEILYRRGIATAQDLPRLGRLVERPELAHRVVQATLNPILVETAALAFIQDLGLTPDIGVGKAKDVIDVRARACDAEGRFDRTVAEKAWTCLRDLDVRADDALRERLLERGVLDIQCKAADRSANAAGVLYFGFEGAETRVHNALLLNHLDRLLDRAEWPNLRRFLKMQERILVGAWAAPAPKSLSHAAGS